MKFKHILRLRENILDSRMDGLQIIPDEELKGILRIKYNFVNNQ